MLVMLSSAVCLFDFLMYCFDECFCLHYDGGTAVLYQMMVLQNRLGVGISANYAMNPLTNQSIISQKNNKRN